MSCLKSVGRIESLHPGITSFLWRLENFNAADTPTGSFLTSPMIPSEHPEITWRLALYPNGRSKKTEDYLDVSIQLFSNMETTSEISTFIKIYLLNCKNRAVVHEKFYSRKVKFLPEKQRYNNLLPEAFNCDCFVLRQFIMNENHHVLLDKNCLRIYCEIVCYSDPIFELLAPVDPSYNNLRLKEFDGFKKLLVDDRFSDFAFVVDDKKIRVHKAILANRSPVFEAMFTNEMQEKKENTAKIVDIQYPVLKELFQYIYSGTVDDIENMASDLLMAADKYCVTGLKALCEKELFKSLNSDNALNRLILADTYNSASLKMQAIQFIANNSSEVVEKEEFAALPSHLMCEVTRDMSRILNKQ